MTSITQSERPDTRDIYSVSEINHELKHLVGSSFPMLWVEGEVSNLARPSSGHIYFSLKDRNAQIRCVMFRSYQKGVDFEVENGMQVIIRAKVSMYEPRGDLQLVADKMEEAGFGALQRQFEALKKKLFAEGLFAEKHKKEIPSFPKEIAIITSPTGAAIKDYLNVVRRRYPVVKISLYCSLVQGDQAANLIRSAINAINRQSLADIIVLIRGGGSIEDLWAFNDEKLAREIFSSKIPVVTGIGHEIDYTIADFVADLRAPTPSIAAELTTPDISTLRSHLTKLQQTITKTSKEYLTNYMQNIDWLLQRLQRNHPVAIVSKQQIELRRLHERLLFKIKSKFEAEQNLFQMLTVQLQSNSPSDAVNHAHTQAKYYYSRLISSMQQNLGLKRHQFEIFLTTMHAISPLNTLDRGYSITIRPKPTTKILSKYDQTQVGDQLVTYLATGHVVSRVESTSSESALIKYRSLSRKAN